MSPTSTAMQIREVGPRDGLQAEEPVTIEARVTLINALAAAGLKHIEAVSFVSPKAVPQMAEPSVVMDQIDRQADVTYWGLVPNRRGAEFAVEAGMDAITVTISACPVYNEKNINRTIDESVEAIGDIIEVADGRPVDAVLSCVFGSPYTGDEPTASTPELMTQLAGRGVTTFTLADTTGMATPQRVERVLEITGSDIGLHLHNTRGTALVNAWHAIGLGVRRFDTALGGLGGSPFAKGAGGNLGTEDLVHLLNDAGNETALPNDTGIDLDALMNAGPDLAEAIGHSLPSPVATHGPR